jgi:transposase
MDFAEYYGIVIRLCYPYRPKTKEKIAYNKWSEFLKR